jgi:NodT family efflux transporter outer membrane factor (OMF) lipoprotein
MCTSANKFDLAEAVPQKVSGLARPLILSFLISVLSLSGCVVGPKYNRPSVQTPAAFKEAGPTESPGSTAWKPAQPRDAANRGAWWKIFQDSQLDQLEDKASASNQNIAAAAASFAAARALVREARSQYFPTASTNPSIAYERPSPAQFAGLSAGASSNHQFTVRPFTDFSLPFDATWEPDFWGRVRSGVHADIFAAQASAADLENVRLSEQAELAVDYYELRAQDSLKQVLDANVTSFQDSLDLNRSLYQSGLSSEEAVAQAEAQLETAQAQDTNLGILRAQYEHAIAVLTGQPASTFSIPPDPLGEGAPVIPVGVPADLLERRPDIAATERAMAQANAQIGVAKSAYFPDVLLSAMGGFGNSTVTSWLTWPSRFWAVGPSVAETVFDAGLRRATMDQYRATYDQAVAQYRQTVLTAFEEVEDNLAALRILSVDIQQQDSAVAAAARSLQEATVRYESGLDPYLNVISAQTILLNDQQTAVTFRMQRIVASVQLIKALGGDWDASQIPSTKQLISDSRSPVVVGK